MLFAKLKSSGATKNNKTLNHNTEERSELKYWIILAFYTRQS